MSSACLLSHEFLLSLCKKYKTYAQCFQNVDKIPEITKEKYEITSYLCYTRITTIYLITNLTNKTVLNKELISHLLMA